MADNQASKNNNSSSPVSLDIDTQRSILTRFKERFRPQQLVVYGLVLMLLLVLYWVMFYLPQSIEQPASVVDGKTLMVKEQKKPLDESPWYEAQLAKFRREAQEVLAKVLEQQKLLDKKQVSVWGQAAYQQAMDAATSGDFHYRQQAFQQAIASYQSALEQLTALSSDSANVFADYYARGLSALEQGNTEQAKSLLQVALYIHPDDQAAQTAFDRSLVLSEVLAQVKSAKQLIAQQRLKDAKSELIVAQQLDPLSPIVLTELASVEQLLSEQRFSKLMSEGFNALNRQQFTQAIDKFEQAKKTIPSRTDAQQAITQAKNQQTANKINALLAKAQQFEQQEQWPQAEKTYQQALEVDNALVKARVGLISAQARGNLSLALEGIIDQPLRLADRGARQQAEQTLADALQITPKGQLLDRQINQVATLLNAYEVPVSIRIESDNVTTVSLQRVGQLGQFNSKLLSLKPGRYVLVGSRDGFRDVRLEITLMPQSAQQTIVIECSERVVNG